MKVFRAREVTINPVQYETIRLVASVEENYPDDANVADIKREMDDMLDLLLEEEISEAAAVTTNPDSIVHEYRIKEGN